MISPLERLYQDIEQHKMEADEAQAQAAKVLDGLYQEIASANLFTSFIQSRSPKGVYLWGGVGRGKTYLMDLFFQALPPSQKERIHFHRFIQDIHQNLAQHQGRKNPLEYIAKQWTKKTKIICLDEFFVEDIVDAMILGELFKNLFKAGVILVMTSNHPPKQLYLNGLQREKFLPAIQLIETYMHIVSLDQKEGPNIDYRFRVLTQAKLYHYPVNQAGIENIEQYFNSLVLHDDIDTQEVFTVLQRPIQTIRIAKEVVWFDFDAICQTPRSSADYIEIARRFHTVFISNLPIMNTKTEEAAKRFITMIDTFYDRQVKVVICAQSGLLDIYQGELWKMEFQRTMSRLTEMQSKSYLSKPHLL